ncbi:hypothetical protein M9H77_18296 [Catharanthus roseus]|uniref:Uncharacterized protein n=1 Tax=Catharanthus roseus TaxID=4058 RepID=A0ACC0B731_CATRO|nr:hypothetical protein M9H77_18296 [Catharanthus roseus]
MPIEQQNLLLYPAPNNCLIRIRLISLELISTFRDCKLLDYSKLLQTSSSKDSSRNIANSSASSNTTKTGATTTTGTCKGKTWSDIVKLVTIFLGEPPFSVNTEAEGPALADKICAGAASAAYPKPFSFATLVTLVPTVVETTKCTIFSATTIATAKPVTQLECGHTGNLVNLEESVIKSCDMKVLLRKFESIRKGQNPKYNRTLRESKLEIEAGHSATLRRHSAREKMANIASRNKSCTADSTVKGFKIKQLVPRESLGELKGFNCAVCKESFHLFSLEELKGFNCAMCKGIGMKSGLGYTSTNLNHTTEMYVTPHESSYTKLGKLEGVFAKDNFSRAEKRNLVKRHKPRKHPLMCNYYKMIRHV